MVPTVVALQSSPVENRNPRGPQKWQAISAFIELHIPFAESRPTGNAVCFHQQNVQASTSVYIICHAARCKLMHNVQNLTIIVPFFSPFLRWTIAILLYSIERELRKTWKPCAEWNAAVLSGSTRALMFSLAWSARRPPSLSFGYYQDGAAGILRMEKMLRRGPLSPWRSSISDYSLHRHLETRIPAPFALLAVPFGYVGPPLRLRFRTRSKYSRRASPSAQDCWCTFKCRLIGSDAAMS